MKKISLPEPGKQVGHGECAPLAHHPLYTLAEVCDPREGEPQGRQGAVEAFWLGVLWVVA